MSNKNQSNKFYGFSKILFNIIFKYYYNVSIIGKENIPKEGATILAGNHKNIFDPCLTFISTNRQIHYMAKKECFDKKIIGWTFRRIGCVPVDKFNSNYSSVKSTLSILSDGGIVGIFPEGTRNKTNNFLLPFKTGAVSMAQKTNAYVVPFAITGDYKFRSKNLKIRFGKPFKINEIDIKEANKRLEDEISKLMKINLNIELEVAEKELIDVRGE